MAHFKTIGNHQDWDRLVAAANTNPPKLMMAWFSASWCPACQQIAPIVNAFPQQYPRVLFAKVDVDEARDVASGFKFKGVPTFIFFYRNQQKAMVSGNQAELTETLARLSRECSVFSGQGNRIIDSPSAPAAPAAPAPAPEQKSQERSRRPNPWADPNWKPPAAVAAPAPAPAAPSAAAVPVASQANDARLSVNQVFLNSLTDMGFSAVRAEKALILTQNRSLDAAMDWLITHSEDIDIDEPLQVVGTSNAAAATPAGPGASAAAAAAAAAAAKPPVQLNVRGAPLGWKPGESYDDEEDPLVKNVRSRVQSERSARKGIAAAPAPAPVRAPAPAPAPAAPDAPAADAPAAPAEAPQSGAAGDDIDEAVLEAQFNAQFSQQPMTREEKLARFEEMRKRIRAEKARAESQAELDREKARRAAAKQDIDMRRAMEDQEARRFIDSKKREEDYAKQRHKKVMDKIKADKERRKQEAAERAARLAAKST
eukprot:TRINITY_DN1534_c0_g2_i1.p1 TRINITY_DN1534_c0_g2~~TRINITY_DN1534_c0_g2_i1.p1  ORF type:complete len:502 (+),score=250.34 TRINITY_DN1534_c0_g2_i1:56-1507(+)